MAEANHGGIRIWWSEHGAGDPLLLIMGLGYTSDMWYRLLPALTPRFRVLVFDNRGVGRSDVPPGPYTVPDMAGDALAVLDAAGVERAHVLGASLGGAVAQELALQHPERVRSLILSCTLAGGPNAVPASPEVLQTLMDRAHMTPEEGVRAMVPHIYDHGTPRERVDEDLAVRLRTFPTAEGYLAQVGAAAGWESESRVDRLGSMPVLVVHGENDGLVPPANGRRLASLIPGARLVMLPNASHVLWTDQPELARDALLEFLEAVPAPS